MARTLLLDVDVRRVQPLVDDLCALHEQWHEPLVVPRLQLLALLHQSRVDALVLLLGWGSNGHAMRSTWWHGRSARAHVRPPGYERAHVKQAEPIKAPHDSLREPLQRVLVDGHGLQLFLLFLE